MNADHYDVWLLGTLVHHMASTAVNVVVCQYIQHAPQEFTGEGVKVRHQGNKWSENEQSQR